MTRRKIFVILGASLCGAAGGALATKLHFHFLASVPALSLDNAFQGRWGFLVACVAGWSLFSLYWDAAAKSAAPAKSTESRPSRVFHVFLVNVALLLEFVPVRGFGRFLPAYSFIMAAGVMVQAIGTFLAVWARRHLGRNWSGAIAIKVEHQLIRSGPYRLLRHPIYTGLLAMYIGPAIVTGEWHALIGVAMAAFAYWRKIRLEEATLEVAFGPDYEAYRRGTWALVPGLF